MNNLSLASFVPHQIKEQTPQPASGKQPETNDNVASGSSSNGKDEAQAQVGTYQVALTIFGKAIVEAAPSLSTNIVKVIERFLIEPEEIYEQGKELKDKDDTLAFGYFQAAAVYGHRYSQDQTASMLLSGTGCTRDQSEAMRFLRMAASHNEASNSWFNLAVQLDSLRQDTEASEWYTKAAEAGHTVAQYNLGRMAFEGRIQEAATKKAISWLRRAAEPSPSEEFPEAVIRANLLLTHIYVQQNQLDLAFHCTLEAGAKRSAEAQLKLALSYLTGRGTPCGSDLSKARSWLQNTLKSHQLDENDASPLLAKHLVSLQSDTDRMRSLKLLRPNYDFRNLSLDSSNSKRVRSDEVYTCDQNKTRPVILEEIGLEILADAFTDCTNNPNCVGITWNIEFLDQSKGRIIIPLAKVILQSTNA